MLSIEDMYKKRQHNKNRERNKFNLDKVPKLLDEHTVGLELSSKME